MVSASLRATGLSDANLRTVPAGVPGFSSLGPPGLDAGGVVVGVDLAKKEVASASNIGAQDSTERRGVFDEVLVVGSAPLATGFFRLGCGDGVGRREGKRES